MSRKRRKKSDKKGISAFQPRKKLVLVFDFNHLFRAESNRWKQHRRFMKTEAARRQITFEDD